MKETGKFERVDVSRLIKADWNYKDSDDDMLTKLTENFKKNGQIETLLVRELETGALEIVNGNHRYDALVLLHQEVAWVCNVGRISNAKARRLAIELNESRFPNDQLRLSGLLKEITKEFGMQDSLLTLPYTEKELEKMLAMENWPEMKKGQEAKEDMIMIKVFMTFEQMEEWTAWKAACGSENDTQAVFKAVEIASQNI